jgi:cytochrome c oxidase subunit IV
MSEGTVVRRTEAGVESEMGHAVEPAPEMLPGEVRPHPSPFKYVLIAVILCVLTAAEVSLYYVTGDVPDSLIVTLLMILMIVKFATVASWYMHLQTDRPIFRRFFVLGVVAAVSLYLIALATLHVFG